MEDGSSSRSIRQGSPESRRSFSKEERLLTIEGAILDLNSKFDRILENISGVDRILEELMRSRGESEAPPPIVMVPSYSPQPPPLQQYTTQPLQYQQHPRYPTLSQPYANSSSSWYHQSLQSFPTLSPSSPMTHEQHLQQQYQSARYVFDEMPVGVFPRHEDLVFDEMSVRVEALYKEPETGNCASMRNSLNKCIRLSGPLLDEGPAHQYETGNDQPSSSGIGPIIEEVIGSTPAYDPEVHGEEISAKKCTFEEEAKENCKVDEDMAYLGKVQEIPEAVESCISDKDGVEDQMMVDSVSQVVVIPLDTVVDYSSVSVVADYQMNAKVVDVGLVSDATRATESVNGLDVPSTTNLVEKMTSDESIELG